MYKINFEKPVHVHFIGIGGISMSGLAEILLKEGFTISGSDNKESALTDHLEKLGAKVFYGQKASNIIPGIDVVVYTAAIHPDNEEYAEAVRQKLPMLTRAELLGQLMTKKERGYLTELYYFALSFFVYGFLGWCTEVAYAAAKQGKFVNRGFLNGPICPVYGIGVGVVVQFLTPVENNLVLLYDLLDSIERAWCGRDHIRRTELRGGKDGQGI